MFLYLKPFIAGSEFGIFYSFSLNFNFSFKVCEPALLHKMRIYFVCTDTGNSLEQPQIEFLMTDKFGIAHTGKRTIPGLTVDFRGTQKPTFQSNRTLSTFFGQALYALMPNYVYIDAPGEELQFTGNSTVVTSFTLGTYIYYPSTDNIYVTDVVIHQYAGQLTDWNYYRLMPHAENGQSGVQMLSTNVGGSSYTLCNLRILSAQEKSGWVHVTYTFDENSKNLKTYVDGILRGNQSFTGMSGNGNLGAYEIFSQLLFYSEERI